MTRAIGVDVSHYDYPFDPSRATKPIDFAIMKAGEGVYRDPKFYEIWSGVSKVPIRGAYWYLRSMWGWQAQADKFLEIVKDYDFHFYALDFEDTGNVMGPRFADMAHMWMVYVSAKAGGKPKLLYTNPNHYDADLSPYGDWMKLCPLWIAQYWWNPSPDANPGMPRNRKDWKIYQYACERNFPGHGHEYGCGGNSVDLNVYNGTVADMRSWLNLLPDTAPIPPAPPIPAPPVGAERYKVLPSALNIRESPSVYADLVAALHAGDVVEAVPVTQVKREDGSVWLHHSRGWSCVSSTYKAYMEKI